MIHSMTYPFLACLILTGIHVYLGIHVIERKVIFVDLALAAASRLNHENLDQAKDRVLVERFLDDVTETPGAQA